MLDSLPRPGAEEWIPIDGHIAEHADTLVTFRRFLHRHPEPSGAEYETTRVIADRLSEAGLQPRILRDGLGVIADLDLGHPAPDAPRIALRGDMDALRIQDEKTTEYRSTIPEVMHACGHDGHTTIILGAAQAAAQHLDWPAGFGVKLRFIFQPAEESSLGALSLIEQDVLAGVDAILSVHLEPAFPVGQVGVRYGVLTAACDELQITILGHGGHGARPHQTRDPILASAELISALYGIIPRRIDSRSPAVLSIAQMQAGRAPNAIPERATLSGTIRTIEQHTRDILLARINDVCAGVATMTGTTVTPDFRHAIPSVVNDPRLTQALETASVDVLGADRVVQIRHASMGGEDFAFYLQLIPGAMLRLGCTPPGVPPQMLHSSRFDFDERCLAIGSRILLRAALAAQSLLAQDQ